jgi:hypothetical protein
MHSNSAFCPPMCQAMIPSNILTIESTCQRMVHGGYSPPPHWKQHKFSLFPTELRTSMGFIRYLYGWISSTQGSPFTTTLSSSHSPSNSAGFFLANINHTTLFFSNLDFRSSLLQGDLSCPRKASSFLRKTS